MCSSAGMPARFKAMYMIALFSELRAAIALVVVGGMGQEDRRRIGRDVDTRPDLVLVFGLQIARITQDGEIGPATDLVDGVDRLILPLGEIGGGRQREMAAGREADDADPPGVDAPFGGPAADQADGPLGVELRAQGQARRWTSPGRRGQRYLRMMPVMPTEFSQAATSSPSSSQ